MNHHRTSSLFSLVAGLALLGGCVTGPLQGDQVTSSSTVTGYFPSTTDTMAFQVENYKTGEFQTCSTATPSTSNPLVDCDGTTNWYPFSLPATLPTSFASDRSCPAGNNGCCVNQPWEYFEPGTAGNNGINTQIVDLWNSSVGPLATFSHNVPVNGTYVPLEQCVEQYSCAGDIINHCSQSAMGLPQTLALQVPCGGTDQQCCLPLPTTFGSGKTPTNSGSCTDSGTWCDWDGFCRYHPWPPAGPLGQPAPDSVYKQDWNVPSNNMQHNWTDQFQGIASDGAFWYFTAGDWNGGHVLPNVFRIPLKTSWDQDFNSSNSVIFAGPYQAPGPAGVHGICGHWGDLDTQSWAAVGNGATLYIPEEQCQDDLQRLLIVKDYQDGRSQPMVFVDEFQLNYGPHHTNQTHAPAVAINRPSQEIYAIGENPASYVHVYRWIGDSLVWNRDLPLLDQNGNLMVLQTSDGGPTAYIQGMAFSPEGGKLYIQSQISTTNPLLGFQVTPSYLSLIRTFAMHSDGWGGFCPQETEGITVLDTDVPGGLNIGQIHGFVYEDHGFGCTGSGGVWAKHIRLLNGDTRF